MVKVAAASAVPMVEGATGTVAVQVAATAALMARVVTKGEELGAEDWRARSRKIPVRRRAGCCEHRISRGEPGLQRRRSR